MVIDKSEGIYMGKPSISFDETFIAFSKCCCAPALKSVTGRYQC